MIAIVDYDMGNVASVANMLKRIGARDAALTRDPEVLRAAERIIIPGVGAFENGMQNLEAFGLLDALNESAHGRCVPILGICLGMQLLTKRSEEGSMRGLGWIDAETIRFRATGDELKIPHMGWSEVRPTRPNPLVDAGANPRYYFVHSYHLSCASEENVIATANYGGDFPAIVNSRNIYGVQFHPEKSHRFGMDLLKRFLAV
jgi:glutamine amidotransferase